MMGQCVDATLPIQQKEAQQMCGKIFRRFIFVAFRLHCLIFKHKNKICFCLCGRERTNEQERGRAQWVKSVSHPNSINITFNRFNVCVPFKRFTCCSDDEESEKDRVKLAKKWRAKFIEKPKADTCIESRFIEKKRIQTKSSYKCSRSYCHTKFKRRIINQS